MKTAIVMPVHNALTFVERSTKQIKEHHPHIYTILVDDASDEETSSYLRKLTNDNKFICVRQDKQQLFTRTVNNGIRTILNPTPDCFLPDIEFIAVVNSDCDLKVGWLESLLECMKEDATIGLVGYRDSTPPTLSPMYEESHHPNFVTGHCLLLRVDALKETGLFCETDLSGIYFPELAAFKGCAHIGSDRLMSYRMRDKGWKTVYCNFPGVEHRAGQSWNHDLNWLANFKLELLWEPNDGI